MELPNDSIGISDIEQHDLCPRRFVFGMRRHAGAEPPEAVDANNAYGSAFHVAVAHAETHNATDAEAIQAAFDSPFGRWLDPTDLESLKRDLGTYRERDYLGVEPVAVERDMRVPLFVYDGRQIFFRFKVDRLYRRLDNPGVFIHVDYKTSRHPRSESEVHADNQMSAYNFGLHELMPEIETLVQVYDQLRFGRIPTRRTPEQREVMREWLIRRATTILKDTQLDPTFNDFCAWCPIMESCPVIGELSDYALAHIAGLAPEVKEGRKLTVQLDPSRMGAYVAQLEKVSKAKGVLERYDKTVRDTIRQMPVDRRVELGFELRDKNIDNWPPEALRAVHELLGDEFYELVGLTKAAVERLPKDQQAVVLAMAVRHYGSPTLRRVA